MRRKLLFLLSLISISLMAISCSIFGNNNDDDNDFDQLRFSIEHNLIAGQSMGISITEGSAEIREVLIDDTKLERIDELQGQGYFQKHYRIPANLKGDYTVVVKVNQYGNDDEETAGVVEADTVAIHTFLGEAYPGVAYRVDLSNAHTILCAGSKVEPTETNPSGDGGYQSLKFAAGKAPIQAKFYNAKGVEVPATFTTIKDISEELFFATMCNARPYDPIYSSSYSNSVEFNRDDFTCQVVMDPHSAVNVVVNKKTGVIARITNDKELPNYLSADSAFQSMGDGIICFMGQGYGSEFSTDKLYKFDASVLFYDQGEQLDPSFQYTIPIELVPGQDNLDIVNGWDGTHWLVLSSDNVLFNRERILENGRLTSINFPSQYVYNIFGCYIHDTYYCVAGGDILNTNGTPMMSSQDGVYDSDIYQFPDSTLVRSRRAVYQKVGETINHYSFTKDVNNYEINHYQEEIKDLSPIYHPIERCFPLYPCTSNYEYVSTKEERTIYRRPIKAIYSPGEEKEIYTPTHQFILLVSASKNAITIIDRGEDFGPSPECVNRIIEVSPQGDLVQDFALDKGLFATGVCRFKD